MAYDPIASRYAQALFESAAADRAVDDTLRDLRFIGTLFHDHPALRQLLLNPDVDPDDKVGVLERAFAGSWSHLLRAFFAMVVSMGRTEFLPQIVEAFQALVDAAQGRLRVMVRAAHPLSEAVLQRLRVRLEHREHKSVELETELAPELLGGVQIYLDHRVIDGSVRRQLTELRERLSAVKVH